jgi:hypothetical protein
MIKMIVFALIFIAIGASFSNKLHSYLSFLPSM